MKIEIRAHGVELTKALRAHLEFRLGFALSRFGERIGRVAVDLSKAEESPRTGTCCEINVGMKQCVKAEWTDADVFAAIDHAVDRAGSAVARVIRREHDHSDVLSQLRIARKRTPRAASLLVIGPTAGTVRPGLKGKLGVGGGVVVAPAHTGRRLSTRSSRVRSVSTPKKPRPRW